jgi:hypothetical protein
LGDLAEATLTRRCRFDEGFVGLAMLHRTGWRACLCRADFSRRGGE